MGKKNFLKRDSGSTNELIEAGQLDSHEENMQLTKCRLPISDLNVQTAEKDLCSRLNN